MKIEILDEAQEDLIEGFRFYEAKHALLDPGSGMKYCHTTR